MIWFQAQLEAQAKEAENKKKDPTGKLQLNSVVFLITYTVKLHCPNK